MTLIDLTHTAHTGSLTGIQRVTRSLWRELGTGAQPICLDPYLRDWRPLEAWEIRNLSIGAPSAKQGGSVPTRAANPNGSSRIPSAKRSVSWPLPAKMKGTLRRFAGSGPSAMNRVWASSTPSTGLIVPEIFSPAVASSLPSLFGRIRGPRVALFYDAIPLTYPELTPAATVARFPAYLCELTAFDGVAAISAESRDALVGYWQWVGARNTPPVVAIPLGLSDFPPPSAALQQAARRTSVPVVLSVGTIEGRKNHLALLEACERLWARGTSFELRLIGMAQAQTGRAALSRIAELQRAGRPLRYDGPVGESELERAYHECLFTVYPSLAEGFGLPVIESVGRRPRLRMPGARSLGRIGARRRLPRA